MMTSRLLHLLHKFHLMKAIQLEQFAHSASTANEILVATIGEKRSAGKALPP